MLYTRKGDGGTSGSFGTKERRAKTDPLFEALGSLDEANSLLGICKSKVRKVHKVYKILEQIQQDLFIIQAEVAGADKHITEEKVKWLEEKVDAIEKTLPPITTFFVSGATEAGAWLDYARAVARRTEREVLRSLGEVGPHLPDNTRAYLNRLSSLLYALARQENQRRGKMEQSPKYE